MSIRFPDLQLLIVRSTQGGQAVRPVNAAETPAYLHAQAAAIQRENVKRRTTVNEGKKADGAQLKGRRDRQGDAGVDRPVDHSNKKGRHLDIQV